MAQTVQTISLSYTEEIGIGSRRRQVHFLAPVVCIDGIAVTRPSTNGEARPIPVDLNELLRSLDEEGQFFPFTCECGVPGCAGFYDGITVARSADLLLWDWEEVWQCLGVEEQQFRLDRERLAVCADGSVASLPRRLAFSFVAFAAAIRAGIEEGRMLAAKLASGYLGVECSPSENSIPLGRPMPFLE